MSAAGTPWARAGPWALALAAAAPAPALASDGTLAVEEARLVAGDGGAWDQLGACVAIDGDTLVAGARWCDDAGADSGAAYVFVRNGTAWTQQAKLVASDAAGDDQFGSAVAIAGDTVIVGAPFDDDTAPSSGSVYVFGRSGTTWTQQAKLLASDAAAGDQLGASVAIAGDTAAAGAVGDKDAGLFTGSAYVFVRNGTLWSEQAKLLPSDPGAHNRFGTSLSLDVEELVAGTVGVARGAYVFRRSGTSWSQEVKLVDPLGLYSDRFGTSVAIEGDVVAVGAPLDDDNGQDSGSVHVFERDVNGWSHIVTLIAGEQLGELGSAVGLDGGRIVAGARMDYNYGDAPQGAAYLFERDGASWSQSAVLAAVEVADGDEYGFAVAISGDRVAVGAPRDDEAGVNSGSAYAWLLVPGPSAYCFGDGSGTPCPCGNSGALGEGGCANSLGVGAVLGSNGVPSVAQDAFILQAANLVPGQPALLFAGLNAVNGGNGVAFGDGLRCAGGGVQRLGVVAPDASGSASWGPGIAALGGWNPGDLRRFQAWYRDPSGSPCGTGFNLSNGLEVIFVP